MSQRIRLKKRWRGYKRGDELDHLSPDAAGRLIAEGLALEVPPDEGTDKKGGGS